MNKLEKEKSYYSDLALSAILFLLLNFFFERDVFVFIGIGVVALGLMIRFFRKWNHLVWDLVNRITQPIGEFVLMFFVYFFVLTPIGILFQISKKKRKTKSTLVDCEELNFPESFKKTW